ncbi:MAG: hypothetical protein HRU09_04020 [Oligoflexales bacterium]|nr:hypothetical protein [Oligoflexales bacterium]
MTEIDLNHYPLNANVRILLTLGMCQLVVSAKGRSINELGMNAIIDLSTAENENSPSEWQSLMESFQSCMVQIESDFVTDPVQVECYLEQTLIYGNVVELNLSFFDNSLPILNDLTSQIRNQWKEHKNHSPIRESPLKIKKAKKRF